MTQFKGAKRPEYFTPSTSKISEPERCNSSPSRYMGDCQNYGPFLGPYYNTGPNLGDPKRDHNFDNPPYDATLMLLIRNTKGQKL